MADTGKMTAREFGQYLRRQREGAPPSDKKIRDVKRYVLIVHDKGPLVAGKRQTRKRFKFEAHTDSPANVRKYFEMAIPDFDRLAAESADV